MKELTHKEVASRGGKNRAKNLTKEQLSAIGRKGGLAGKGKTKKRPKRVIHSLSKKPVAST